MPDTKLLPPFKDPLIEAAFERFPNDLRPHLLALRQQIFATAATIEDCLDVTESLKWGQPSYRANNQTGKKKNGTPIRLGIPKSANGHYALYVHCQTTLVETIRHLYPDEFRFEGTRALLMHKDMMVREKVLRHVISMTLTYNRSSTSLLI